MRILKEYSALTNPVTPTAQNSRFVKLLHENKESVLDFIGECTSDTDINYKVLNPLKMAAGEIFDILAQNAGAEEETLVSCTYHKYYYMLVFEFSESALPLHTLNRSVKFLDPLQKNVNSDDVIGFMNAVNLVNRIALSVDKITEKMRITVIKEKKYPAPKSVQVCELCEPFKIYNVDNDNNHNIVNDFSVRLFNKYGDVCDKFMIVPGLFADNIAAGELETTFLCDKNGNGAGGAVWQKTHGIIVLMVFALFIPKESTCYDESVSLLLNEFKQRTEASGVSFIVSKKEHCEDIADFFNVCDDKYCYKSTQLQKIQTDSDTTNGLNNITTSYIKPDLIPLIKKSYKKFDINRQIKEINYNYRFIEPCSVLTAIIDAEASEAVLSILWFGDDLKLNIIRHITALKKLKIDNIYFRLDLGVAEEASVSDLIQSCGFEAQYLWPYSNGDIVVFTYYGSAVYEMKPCVISPINKNNIDKTPSLVRKIYADKYPSQYLYEPHKLWDKIRKRQVYPYIAIDDEQTAVGMISFVKLEINPYLFEIGQLMVDPEHRGTNVVNQLIEYLYNTGITSLDFDAVLSESVTNHKLSQRSCVNGGFCDTGLKLNIMAAEAFSMEEERRQIGRMSCVVSCIERADEMFTVFLPDNYKDEVKFCFDGLKMRDFKPAIKTAPEPQSITGHHINDDEADTSKLVNITFFNIGADLGNVIDKLEQFVNWKGVKSVMVNIPLTSPYTSYAVDVLKLKGFFFGGVMPYWYPEADALLMQKLYDNTPDWDNIKLFSRKIKKIAEIIKKEMQN